MQRTNKPFALAAAMIAMLATGVAGCGSARSEGSQEADITATDRPALGLMTSLPIYWGEAEGFADLLAPADDGAEQHWVRRAIEEEYELLPLDSLAAEDGSSVTARLADLDFLLLAQPYTLTPADNVALDDWVRGGGRLLMFADPVLTEHSRFALGDRRRPQDIGLVPPVFARWGIAQSYREDQPEELVELRSGALTIPVNRRGEFSSLSDTPDTGDKCVIDDSALIAECAIGSGSAVLVADAALLEDHRTASREDALAVLIERSFVK